MHGCSAPQFRFDRQCSVNHLHAFPHAGEAESIVLTRFFRDEVYDVTIPIHDSVENVLLTLSSILGAARKWGYKVPTVRISHLSLPRKMKA
jgi:hypothetical protein